ncbi:hypothetical protein [Phenylobacterium soli]|uniref:Lipoprotein n=1 Tax=Phenylobacterium soli TaxID=2170551 RepID=A0A328AGT1_9CAUL|nr:hypothetical protein [Phenylobacterium soli]RAK53940.1 hypothetical protein DJ017_05090 [Phenylobacterium soli]
MRTAATKLTLTALLTGAVALSGCASIDSVKRAQATADQALAMAQSDQAASQHAQSSADAAAAAAQRAQSSADAAASAAQSAQSAAQAASAQVGDLSTRVDRMQRQRATSGKRHHRTRHHAPAATGANAGERG